MPKITRHGGATFALPKKVDHIPTGPPCLPGPGTKKKLTYDAARLKREERPTERESSRGEVTDEHPAERKDVRPERERVREWALSAGYIAPVRGRMPTSTIKAYREAHPSNSAESEDSP